MCIRDRKYGSMIKLASEVTDTDLYIPSTFFALNYLFGKGTVSYTHLSLYKWFSKEEIDKSHREKIAERQKGENNSNRINS